MKGFATIRAFPFALNLAITASLLAILCGCHQGATKHGVLESVADWPDPIQVLFDRLRTVDPNVEMEGYLLSGGPGPNSIQEAAFRVRNVSTELSGELKSVLGLVGVQRDHKLADWGDHVIENSSKDWWCSPGGGDTELFASQFLLDGEEGDLYIVAHEVSTNTMYICYYFNF